MLDASTLVASQPPSSATWERQQRRLFSQQEGWSAKRWQTNKAVAVAPGSGRVSDPPVSNSLATDTHSRKQNKALAKVTDNYLNYLKLKLLIFSLSIALTQPKDWFDF